MTLEALSDAHFRERLGYWFDAEIGIAPLAQMVRACVSSWRSPARSRVSGYLHRQLAAAGYSEEEFRDRVKNVIDALIDIGDLTSVRIDGNLSLVSSRALSVIVSKDETVVLGEDERQAIPGQSWRYARSLTQASGSHQPRFFPDWIGPADFRLHQRRRSGGGSANGTIREYWSVLVAALRHEGAPIDPKLVRAMVRPPSEKTSYFGRHNLSIPDGRWSTEVPPGTWCAVRPGRNPNEWHPILLQVEQDHMHALDLFDWDEWNWALLARGIAIGPPERSSFNDGVLAFEHYIPAQFVRALRLLAGPGDRAWTWQISDEAFQCFDEWRSTEI